MSEHEALLAAVAAWPRTRQCESCASTCSISTARDRRRRTSPERSGRRGSSRRRRRRTRLVPRRPGASGMLPAGNPTAFMRPRTTREVQAAVRSAARHGISIVPRGAGTGLSDGANAIDGCLVVSPRAHDRRCRTRCGIVDRHRSTGVVNDRRGDGPSGPRRRHRRACVRAHRQSGRTDRDRRLAERCEQHGATLAVTSDEEAEGRLLMQAPRLALVYDRRSDRDACPSITRSATTDRSISRRRRSRTQGADARRQGPLTAEHLTVLTLQYVESRTRRCRVSRTP